VVLWKLIETKSVDAARKITIGILCIDFNGIVGDYLF
jgi:hypothetical protein